jgi:hypothetical protein
MTELKEPQGDRTQARARRRRPWSTAVALGLACSLACGCGPARDPNLPPTAPASGQVMYKGKPIDHGAVTLHPVGEGNPAVGAIDENGKFTLSTYARGDGAVLGQHKVTVDIPPPLDGIAAGEVLSVPRAYTKAETSPLSVEITADGKNYLELVVEDR